MRFVFFSLVISLFFLSCSRKGSEELFKDGQAAEEQKNFQLAIERYGQIVDDYQEQAYAESSQYRIAMIYNNEIRDMQKAVTAYQKFNTLFPESKMAPTMLFLTGFLYNNELHILDSARIMYETFLQKYPDHELAMSAKFELETLGKDPSQLLKQEVATSQESKDKKNQQAPKQ